MKNHNTFTTLLCLTKVYHFEIPLQRNNTETGFAFLWNKHLNSASTPHLCTIPKQGECYWVFVSRKTNPSSKCSFWKSFKRVYSVEIGIFQQIENFKSWEFHLLKNNVVTILKRAGGKLNPSQILEEFFIQFKVQNAPCSMTCQDGHLCRVCS